MTWAVEHPNQRRWSRRSGTSSRNGVHVSVRPIGAAEVGLLAALVGAWGAISVFVGPIFGYQPTSAGSWAWTTQNWLLHLLPGAVAVVAGLMILSASPSRRHEGTGAPIGLAALMIVVAGAWFVIGPAAWATFESGPPFATGTSPMTSFLHQLGSSLGPGLLLAVLGGMALKAVIARPAATVHDVPVDDRGSVPGSGTAAGSGPGAGTWYGEHDQGTGDEMARDDTAAIDPAAPPESRSARETDFGERPRPSDTPLD